MLVEQIKKCYLKIHIQINSEGGSPTMKMAAVCCYADIRKCRLQEKYFLVSDDQWRVEKSPFDLGLECVNALDQFNCLGP